MKLWRRTWSEDTLEEWTNIAEHRNSGGSVAGASGVTGGVGDRGSPSPTLGGSAASALVSGGRPKSHTLPKSQSLHEQLWEGIQRKSVDFLRGGSNLLTRTNSKDDSPAAQQVTLPSTLLPPPPDFMYHPSC